MLLRRRCRRRRRRQRRRRALGRALAALPARSEARAHARRERGQRGGQSEAVAAEHAAATTTAAAAASCASRASGAATAARAAHTVAAAAAATGCGARLRAALHPLLDPPKLDHPLVLPRRRVAAATVSASAATAACRSAAGDTTVRPAAPQRIDLAPLVRHRREPRLRLHDRGAPLLRLLLALRTERIDPLVRAVELQHRAAAAVPHLLLRLHYPQRVARKRDRLVALRGVAAWVVLALVRVKERGRTEAAVAAVPRHAALARPALLAQPPFHDAGACTGARALHRSQLQRVGEGGCLCRDALGPHSTLRLGGRAQHRARRARRGGGGGGGGTNPRRRRDARRAPGGGGGGGVGALCGEASGGGASLRGACASAAMTKIHSASSSSSSSVHTSSPPCSATNGAPPPPPPTPPPPPPLPPPPPPPSGRRLSTASATTDGRAARRTPAALRANASRSRPAREPGGAAAASLPKSDETAMSCARAPSGVVLSSTRVRCNCTTCSQHSASSTSAAASCRQSSSMSLKRMARRGCHSPPRISRRSSPSATKRRHGCSMAIVPRSRRCTRDTSSSVSVPHHLAHRRHRRLERRERRVQAGPAGGVGSDGGAQDGQCALEQHQVARRPLDGHDQHVGQRVADPQAGGHGLGACVEGRHLGELRQLACRVVVVVHKGPVGAQRVRRGAAQRGVWREGRRQRARSPREKRRL
eukprot:scaffold84627_cov48-Phaeocystis_antarctica.AAC.2